MFFGWMIQHRNVDNIQLILIICRFHNCKFAITYLQAKMNIGTLHSHLYTCTEQQKFWGDPCTQSNVRSDMLSVTSFSSYYKHIAVYLGPHFLLFCFLFVISLFKMAPMHDAEVWSNVFSTRAVMVLGRKYMC